MNRWFLIILWLNLMVFAGFAITNAQQPPGVAPGMVIPGQPAIYPAVTGFSGQQPGRAVPQAQQPALQAQTTQPQMTPTPALQVQTPQQLTPQQAEALKRLTPDQQKAIQTELGKTGGQLTPEAIEALKVKPEFQLLTPEDVIKGKEALERKEKEGEKKEPEKKITDIKAEKKLIEEKPGEKTLFDRFRRVGGYQDIPLDIRPFGYDFFQEAAVKVITDRKDIPVPSQYVIGPGDEVKILLWGRVNAQYNLIVDRNGNITIPQIGPIPVAGLTFENMSKHLIKQAEQIVGANIDITMGALKSIPIFVLGDVKRPGAYTVGSFATITDALLIAGGPSYIGTMRNIQLKRKDHVVVTFDLYDLLLKGDKSKDVILQAGDVVFVPVAGPVVGIAGNVKRPAIYELKDKSTLYNLFELSGGILPTAYTQQIQVERIIKNENQIIFDIDDKDISKSKNIILQDGDFIKIFSIVDRDVNVVHLLGNVKKPGKYEYKDGMKVSDLLKDYTELLEETYFDYALIKRLKPITLETQLIPINLNKCLFQDKSHNIELKPQDTLYIFSKWFFKDRPYVTVEGEIRRQEKQFQDIRGESRYLVKGSFFEEIAPHEDEKAKKEKETEQAYIDLYLKGKIRVDETERERIERYLQERAKAEREEKKAVRVLLRENMRVKDAILTAGGLTEDAYLFKAEIVRKDSNGRYERLYFNLDNAMKGSIDDNLLLQDNDRIIIHSKAGYVYPQRVFIDGEVLRPGPYYYTENMTVKDLIFAAGNILESAYLESADVSFQIIDYGKSSTIEHRKINLRKVLEGDLNHNIILKPYSRVFVQKIPDWRREQFVTLSGEVWFPGRYIIKKGETLSSIIERAGGYTDRAYLRGAVFTRKRVRDLQQKNLEEMILRLEKDIMAESNVRLSTALSAEEVAGIKAQQEGTQRLLDALKRTQATGRMTITLAHPRLLKGSEFDVELEDGDSLYIPTKNNVVLVAGAVMVPGSFIYNETLDHDAYITKAGGLTRYADTKNMFILKVDGSAVKIPNRFITWSNENARWEVTAFGEERKMLEPGDTIVIPEKIEAIAWMRGLRDITQILMQMAITGGQLKYMYRNN
ncbi:MAG: SLBB domain-containing protein [Syntrophorhabdaceae bacterium]|nr:SLBB domain-containing protein [Syntrophorhabdaceae bacterium]